MKVAYCPENKLFIETGAGFVKEKVIPVAAILLCGGALLIVFPLLVVGLNPEISKIAAVNREKCRCNCWDALMNNGHFTNKGYLSIYMNMDISMGIIVAHTILFAVLSYHAAYGLIQVLVAAVKHRLWGIQKYERAPDLLPLLLFLIGCIYPVFYGYWALLNYFNARRYDMMFHQTYFYITEVIVATCLLELMWWFPEKHLNDYGPVGSRDLESLNSDDSGFNNDFNFQNEKRSFAVLQYNCLFIMFIVANAHLWTVGFSEFADMLLYSHEPHRLISRIARNSAFLIGDLGIIGYSLWRLIPFYRAKEHKYAAISYGPFGINQWSVCKRMESNTLDENKVGRFELGRVYCLHLSFLISGILLLAFVEHSFHMIDLMYGDSIADFMAEEG
eukprot:Platyproteum_vivax@DN7434_c0_g1_i1.p1